MGKTNEKTLIMKIIDLESYTETALIQSNFPRSQRYLLCTDIRREVSTLLDLGIRAMKGYIQKSTLRDMDVTIEKMRWRIRISSEKGYISLHRLTVWMKLLNEVGAMVGGWIKKHQEKEIRKI